MNNNCLILILDAFLILNYDLFNTVTDQQQYMWGVLGCIELIQI